MEYFLLYSGCFLLFTEAGGLPRIFTFAEMGAADATDGGNGECDILMATRRPY